MVANYIDSELELLQRVAAGDAHAFSILYGQYSKKVFLFASRILNSELLAEEVMQETMLKIWLLGKKLTEVNHLESYIKTVSRNLCYNQLRRIKLEIKADELIGRDWIESHNETEEKILLNDTRQVLYDGINLLPPQQKIVFQMCHLQGMKYDEVAKLLNLSPLSVQTYMKLALRFLRKYVAEHTDLVIALIILKLI